MPGSCTTKDRPGRRFPTELLLAVFIHLDGSTLASCAAVCREWHSIINNSYDDVIWKSCSLSDFHKQKTATRRFWSLHFPNPQHYNPLTHRYKRTWQDMYRITKNWFTGNCYGSFPKITTTTLMASSLLDDRAMLSPQVVVGIPQEHTFATTLTMTSSGHIIRSNPTYRRPDGPQCLIIQSPWTREYEYLDETEEHRMHTVFCHYTHLSSKWLVTGSLDGTVALWDTVEKRMLRSWEGHRGRVLCVAMNNQVVVSGGSDSMIRVWDLPEKSTGESRGMIDISSYLSARSDWIQGVGEIAVNEHLIACSPDASGPILVFSLLTGSLVYELSTAKAPLRSTMSWDTAASDEEEEEEMTGFTKLCLTPYFLLTKGTLPSHNDDIPVIPRPSRAATDTSTQSTTAPTSTTCPSKPHSYGYIARLDDSSLSHTPTPPAGTTQQMTPYQLYQYYQSINNNDPPYVSASASSSSSSSSSSVPDATTATTAPGTNRSASRQIRGCINVWDLQTGSIVYRLVPEFDHPAPETGYTITDIRTSPDSSKVYACIEIRKRHQRHEKLFCWNFAGTQKGQPSPDEPCIVQIDGQLPQEQNISNTLSSYSSTSHHHQQQRQTVGHSWVCFM
ncbi:WD40-repeat-containing domain protein [Zychaea mexicana]|uniref:WD40-repeat-containing domain protein n=1 Tax=Zychaea mexicana TaxID=64656 RepID=UPI0022FE942C|nr:WD40-repeat-containing domain protein [Zychaea mexicana]KAI9498400.1 WD40-repeat-containing domain protein [Zychaea mexicana]